MNKEMRFFEHMTDLIVFVDMAENRISYKNQCAADVLLTGKADELLINLVKKDKNKGWAVVEIEQVVYELQFQESFQNPNIWMVRGNPVEDMQKSLDYSTLLKPYHGRVDFIDKLKELQNKEETDIGIILVEVCAKKEYFAERDQTHALLDLVQQSFRHYEIFHISTNTFLIMTYELTQDEFNEKRARLHGYIEGCQQNMIYFGYAWCEDADEIRNQIALADTYLQQRKERAQSSIFPTKPLQKEQLREQRTLLIIDKDLALKDKLNKMLQEKYLTTQTDNWMEALTNRKKQIDLILLEADNDGRDFLSYIRKYNMFYQVPIIIFYSKETQDLEFYYQNGISHGIQKPFQKEIVQYKIENTMKYIEFARAGNHYGSLDKVTGLANVDYFYDLSREIIEEYHQEEQMVFVYFDIENFKNFNSEYGYDEGDELLRKLAILISDTFTKYFVGRTSNDHFIVLTDEKNLERKIKRIHERTHQLKYNAAIELRAGIYLYEQGVSVAQAHDRAKTACDALKGNINRVFRYYDQELRDKMLQEKYVVDHIEEAIKSEKIVVYYQPIKRVFSGKVCAMEALARWNDPELGFLSPADFIPILEKRFLIHKLDSYIVDRVCRDIVSSEELGEKALPVSINFSRLDFQLMDVCKLLQDTTGKYGVDPKLLHPEVTESTLNDEEGMLGETVEKLRKNGFEIWLDDFGSEYSSLNTLQNFRFDLLKIDMKLMSSFETNPDARIIIASIVDMAKRLHMRVLAEGVETEKEYEFLRQIGCDKAQGYYICKPSPIEALYGKNIDVENESDEAFFTSIGRVNFLSPNPMDEGSNGPEIYNVIPTAIVRYANQKFEYLYANQGFKDCLHSMGVTSMEEFHLIINDDTTKLKTRLVGVAQKSHLNKQMESVDFIFNGEHINVRTKEIYSSEESQGLFVTMMNLSQTENIKKIEKLESSLNFLYSIYERVDLLDMGEDCIENIYMSSHYYRTLFDGKTLKESIVDYANTDICMEDREKFLKFYDVDTLDERISKYGKDYIVNTIRTMTQKDGVHLQLYIIIRIKEGDSIRYLSCVRDRILL